MSSQENIKLQQDRWQNDEANWYLAFLYFNRKDKRLLVPKRNKLLGLTLNFASPGVYVVVAVIVGVIVFL